jgi:sigma-B regulation protein RsbU (phosphoserine phosphatase)
LSIRSESDPSPARTLSAAVTSTFSEFEQAFGVSIRLLEPPSESGTAAEVLYASPVAVDGAHDTRRIVDLPEGGYLELEIAAADSAAGEAVGAVLGPAIARVLDADREARFFTLELSERYEEINLLYSISETLGFHLDDAARVILREVCDVMGAKRGSLWVNGQDDDQSLHLTAAVGHSEPFDSEDPDPDAVTSMVFQEERAVIASRTPTRAERDQGLIGDSLLSVPIRYTPPAGESRTVGVVNLVGRKNGERFSTADQKLLAAIASQVGAALENNRLVNESLSKERMAKEMELAMDLQQKLLPQADRFPDAEAAARVEPAEQVGGDFYQLFSLSGGRVGVMLGDVSLHGFPSALIMTLTMSAAGIYAREHDSPAQVLRDLDDALREELETTEMFLTVFYGVVDPKAGTLCYSNAGHPHAFSIHADGGLDRLTATDPPVGFAGPDSYGEKEVPWSSEDDLLLLFTDGLSDTLASATRGDGEERVLDTVIANRRRPATLIVDELFSLMADADPKILGDDRTALVARF